VSRNGYLSDVSALDHQLACVGLDFKNLVSLQAKTKPFNLARSAPCGSQQSDWPRPEVQFCVGAFTRAGCLLAWLVRAGTDEKV